MSNVSNISLMNAALQVREAQLSLTASNLANQDTPDFKAKGIDFKSALDKKINSSSISLNKTSDRHIGGGNTMHGMNVQYVDSGSVRGDGNSVNSDLEKIKFSEFQVAYQLALSLGKKSTDSLKNILKSSK